MANAFSEKYAEVKIFKDGRYQGSRKIMRTRWSPEVRQRVYDRTGGYCYLCKGLLPRQSPWHIEHVLAFSDNPAGHDVKGNLLPAHATCNLKKGAKTLEECMTMDCFSLDTAIVQCNSLDANVRKVLLIALSIKRQGQAGLSEADINGACDELEEKFADNPTLTDFDASDIVWSNDEIGKGSQGVVRKAKLKSSGRDIAVKKLPILRADHESMIAKLGDHNSLVQVIGQCKNPPAPAEPQLLMERMDGDLSRAKGRRIFFSDVLGHTLHLLTGLHHIHEQGLIHRDIKPQNILYSTLPKSASGWTGVLKIADFGLLSEAHDGTMSVVGTPVYRAPEVRSGNHYTSKADIYSFGMTLQELKRGYTNLKEEDANMVDTLCKRCIKRKPEDRPTAEELCKLVVEKMPRRAIVKPKYRQPPARCPEYSDTSSSQLIAKLEGHNSWIYGVPITSDGKLASVSNHEIRLWDIKSQTLETTLKGHSDIIFSLALSPDRQTFASGSSDKTVRLWNLNNKQQICTLAIREDPIYSVAFSPGGQILASGGNNKYKTRNGQKTTIYLWDIASQQAITTLSAHDLRINTLAFSLDGKTLASGSNDKTVRLWDIASVQQLNIFEGHTSKVATVSFTADGQHLISSGGGGIKIWNLSTGQVQNFVEEPDYISCFTIHPDGKTIAFDAFNGVEIWNLENREKLAYLDSKCPVSLSFSPDGNLLAVGDTSAFEDSSGSVKLWKLSYPQESVRLM